MFDGFAPLLYLPLALFAFYLLYWLVKKAKRMPNWALLLLALMPIISIFPIPPPVFKNVDLAKQEQKKDREASGDPPDDLET